MVPPRAVGSKAPRRGAETQLVTLELSYSNPGARSAGFGGAFVALAEDAEDPGRPR